MQFVRVVQPGPGLREEYWLEFVGPVGRGLGWLMGHELLPGNCWKDDRMPVARRRVEWRLNDG